MFNHFPVVGPSSRRWIRPSGIERLQEVNKFTQVQLVGAAHATSKKFSKFFLNHPNTTAMSTQVRTPRASNTDAHFLTTLRLTETVWLAFVARLLCLHKLRHLT